ncbi:MAG: radical SAM protein [Roseburia sp.]|nr:radical SAM protein [Roseburia sp.]
MVKVEKDIHWREKELSIKEVIEKYPEVSPFVIIKTDAQRRGVTYTQKALERVDENVHQLVHRGFSGEKNDKTPFSLLLRDGTSVLTGGAAGFGKRDPLVVDVVDDKIVLTDNGEVLEEVSYWEKPDFYEKFTSSGEPMWHVAWARPQRIDLNPHQYCQFWNTPGHGCKYCSIAATYKSSDKPQYVNLDDIEETVKEALKQPGRFTSIFLTGGTILSGKELLDDEVDLYINILQRIGKNFGGKRFPSQLIGTAFNRRQLQRIHDETGLMSYTADIEVLNAELFDWICPGKSAKIGYEEWKDRLYQAVDIFGKGYVNTGLVAGVEMAKPKGFISEEESLGKVLEEAEELCRHGVAPVGCVWTVAPGSIFFKQETPSLEYYVRLAKGFDGLRRKYDISVDMDNYRRCGNHPDSDLSRV